MNCYKPTFPRTRRKLVRHAARDCVHQLPGRPRSGLLDVRRRRRLSYRPTVLRDRVESALFSDDAWVTLRRRVLIGIVVAYLAICFVQLGRPGLEYDEVLYGDAALGSRTGAFLTYEWNLGRLRIPVMLMTYIGGVRAWLYAPIFAIFGVSPWTVRLPMIALGVVTLLCVERIARPMFGLRAALLATALLALDPSFVFGTREDYGFISIMLATKTASLALLFSFAQTQRRLHLFLAFFLLGLGLFDKFNFAWHLGAVTLAAVVVWQQVRPFLTRRNFVLAATGFLTGCWPLIVYNVVSRGGTLSSVEAEPSFGGAIQAKVSAIQMTLEGTAFPGFALASLPESSSLLPWAVPLSLIAALVSRRHLAVRWFGFCWLVVVLIVGAILVTPKATGGHHAMMLWPFLHMVLAAGAVSFLDASRGWDERGRAMGNLVPIALLALVASFISLDVKTLVSFARSGGRGIWSDAIYDLAGTISGDSAHRYLIMDWGMSNQVRLLSDGKARQEEIFWSLTEPGRENEQIAYLEERLRDPENRFVFMAPGRANFAQPRHVFESVLQKNGLREEVLEQFKERDGHEVYRIVRAASDQSPSPAAGATQSKAELVATTDRGWFRAERNQNSCVGGTMVLTLKWLATGAEQTEVHVTAPDGALFTRSGATGTAVTGQWVTPGMAFYLQDTTPGRTPGAGTTIAKLRADFACP